MSLSLQHVRMDILIFISTLLLKTVLTQPCGHTEFVKIADILYPKTEGGFSKSTIASRADCASRCQRTTDCWSFYHNPVDQQCFMASRYQVVVPDTSYSDTTLNRFDLFRKPGGFSTCLELLQSNPSATDGDCWLYPTAAVVHNNIVKLYCHSMATGSPKEYVSLPVTNSGEYPNETFQMCTNYRNYLSASSCQGNNGIYHYDKIRVDPGTMSVERNDRTFVTGSGTLRDYAWAGDCYSELDSTYTCGPKGTFTINTVGTGLKVDPTLTWVRKGYKSKVVMVKSQGDAVIALTCGGYSGYCVPQTTMISHLNTADGGFSTCVELLQSNPSATDGDYWLYPIAAVVHNNIVKLYCHNMATGSPKEYVSLPVTNSGDYPSVTNPTCQNENSNLPSACTGYNGIYHYNKIRVDPGTMSVVRNDRAFVTGSGKLRDYAWAGDCYSTLRTCDPKGTFTINTVGTGLKVNPALTWKRQGYQSKVVMVKSQGGAVIQLTCGGYYGNCIPVATMILHLNTADVVSPASATLKI